MDLPKMLAWFEELAEKLPVKGRNFSSQVLARWAVEAQAAIQGVFPPSHPTVNEFRQALREPENSPYENDLKASHLIGAFEAAHNMARAGRFSSFVEEVRAGTLDELLDQADALNKAGAVIAAAVIAGGALETHLRRLCDRNGLTWKGDGSISKYDGAIAQERNKPGREIYSATDTKQVTTWGGMRNDAAHTPQTFASTPAEQVRIMIEGIRHFISKTK